MSKYAFRTSNKDLKNDVVEIKDALIDLKGTKYYCPGEGCKAILTFVDDKRSPHFSALPKHPHIKDCYYAAGNVKYNPLNYNEKKFDFNKVLQNLMKSSIRSTIGVTNGTNNSLIQPSSKQSAKPSIRTLETLYRMCKSYNNINDKYNGIKILTMLVDDRSKNYYTTGMWGLKIIEAQFKGYRDPHKYKDHSYAFIYLEVPYKTRSMIVQLTFKDNDNLYYFYKNRIYNNQNHKIIVAGDWHTSKSKNINSYGYIYDRKQLVIN